MFFYSLSEQTFNKGLKIYLSKSTSNPEGVAKPDHLYDALQLAADDDNATLGNKSIAELFGSWENQAGYPILYVERSYNNRMIRFTQVGWRLSFGLFVDFPSTVLWFSLTIESIYGFNRR